MNSQQQKKEGWTWLINSKVDHYFVDGRSLCGKWACFGTNFYDPPDHPCATCKKRLEKRKNKGGMYV